MGQQHVTWSICKKTKGPEKKMNQAKKRKRKKPNKKDDTSFTCRARKEYTWHRTNPPAPTARDLIAQQNPHARSAPANKPWAPPHLFPSLSPSLVLETHRENNLWNLRRSEEAHLFSPHVLPTPHPAWSKEEVIPQTTCSITALLIKTSCT